MENLPLVLLALACPLGMVLMMLFMGRGMTGMFKRGHSDNSPATADLPSDPEKRLAVLQAQRQLLDAQIGAAAQQPGSGRTAGHSGS